MCCQQWHTVKCMDLCMFVSVNPENLQPPKHYALLLIKKKQAQAIVSN